MKINAVDVSRRRFMASAVAIASTLRLKRAARALGLSAAAGACALSAEQEVGPYYVADEMLRSDIVEGKAGVRLWLRIMVLDARDCKPLPDAAVDIWHCDALGLYSGFSAQNPMGPGGPGGGFGGPPPDFDPNHPGDGPGPPPGGIRPPPGDQPPGSQPPENHPTDKLTFLRGIQLTGADGAVHFKTVFPGFYVGRTNHIHFKVRLGGEDSGKAYVGGHTSHIGQVFFPEDVARGLMQNQPYSMHKIHRTTPGEDEVFNRQHGDRSIAKLIAETPGQFSAGMRAELVAWVDPSATPAPAHRIGGPAGMPLG